MQHDNNNKVVIVLPPKDSVVISDEWVGLNYPGDHVIIGETRIYSSNIQMNLPAGFEILKHLEQFGNNKILSIDSINFEEISIPDSFNYPCLLINEEGLDTNKVKFSNFIFCRLEDDTIRIDNYSSWMSGNSNYQKYKVNYYKNQRFVGQVMLEKPREIHIPLRPKKK